MGTKKSTPTRISIASRESRSISFSRKRQGLTVKVTGKIVPPVESESVGRPTINPMSPGGRWGTLDTSTGKSTTVGGGKELPASFRKFIMAGSKSRGKSYTFTSKERLRIADLIGRLSQGPGDGLGGWSNPPRFYLPGDDDDDSSGSDWDLGGAIILDKLEELTPPWGDGPDISPGGGGIGGDGPTLDPDWRPGLDLGGDWILKHFDDPPGGWDTVPGADGDQGGGGGTDTIPIDPDDFPDWGDGVADAEPMAPADPSLLIGNKEPVLRSLLRKMSIDPFRPHIIAAFEFKDFYDNIAGISIPTTIGGANTQLDVTGASSLLSLQNVLRRSVSKMVLRLLTNDHSDGGLQWTHEQSAEDEAITGFHNRKFLYPQPTEANRTVISWWKRFVQNNHCGVDDILRYLNTLAEAFEWMVHMLDISQDVTGGDTTLNYLNSQKMLWGAMSIDSSNAYPTQGGPLGWGNPDCQDRSVYVNNTPIKQFFKQHLGFGHQAWNHFCPTAIAEQLINDLFNISRYGIWTTGTTASSFGYYLGDGSGVMDAEQERTLCYETIVRGFQNYKLEKFYSDQIPDFNFGNIRFYSTSGRINMNDFSESDYDAFKPFARFNKYSLLLTKAYSYDYLYSMTAAHLKLGTTEVRSLFASKIALPINLDAVTSTSTLTEAFVGRKRVVASKSIIDYKLDRTHLFNKAISLGPVFPVDDWASTRTNVFMFDRDFILNDSESTSGNPYTTGKKYFIDPILSYGNSDTLSPTRLSQWVDDETSKIEAYWRLLNLWMFKSVNSGEPVYEGGGTPETKDAAPTSYEHLNWGTDIFELSNQTRFSSSAFHQYFLSHLAYTLDYGDYGTRRNETAEWRTSYMADGGWQELASDDSQATKQALEMLILGCAIQSDDVRYKLLQVIGHGIGFHLKPNESGQRSRLESAILSVATAIADNADTGISKMFDFQKSTVNQWWDGWENPDDDAYDNTLGYWNRYGGLKGRDSIISAINLRKTLSKGNKNSDGSIWANDLILAGDASSFSSSNPQYDLSNFEFLWEPMVSHFSVKSKMSYRDIEDYLTEVFGLNDSDPRRSWDRRSLIFSPVMFAHSWERMVQDMLEVPSEYSGGVLTTEQIGLGAASTTAMNIDLDPFTTDGGFNTFGLGIYAYNMLLDIIEKYVTIQVGMLAANMRVKEYNAYFGAEIGETIILDDATSWDPGTEAETGISGFAGGDQSYHHTISWGFRQLRAIVSATSRLDGGAVDLGGCIGTYSDTKPLRSIDYTIAQWSAPAAYWYVADGEESGTWFGTMEITETVTDFIQNAQLSVTVPGSWATAQAMTDVLYDTWPKFAMMDQDVVNCLSMYQSCIAQVKSGVNTWFSCVQDSTSLFGHQTNSIDVGSGGHNFDTSLKINGEYSANNYLDANEWLMKTLAERPDQSVSPWLPVLPSRKQFTQFMKNDPSPWSSFFLACVNREQVSTNHFMWRKYCRLPGGIMQPYLPAGEQVTTDQAFLLALPFPQYIREVDDGRKRIVCVGLPGGFTEYLRNFTISYSNKSVYRKSTRIEISLFRRDLQHDTYVWYPSTHQFLVDLDVEDMTLAEATKTVRSEMGMETVFENSISSGIPSAICKRNVTLGDVVDNAAMIRFYGSDSSGGESAPPSSTRPRFGASRYGDGIPEYGLTNAGLIGRNHINDYYFKRYIKHMLGIKMDEASFCIKGFNRSIYPTDSQNIVSVDVEKRNFFVSTVKDIVFETFPDAGGLWPDIGQALSYQRVTSELARSFVFSQRKYLKMALLPKAFERIFCFLIDERNSYTIWSPSSWEIPFTDAMESEEIVSSGGGTVITQSSNLYSTEEADVEIPTFYQYFAIVHLKSPGIKTSTGEAVQTSGGGSEELWEPSWAGLSKLDSQWSGFLNEAMDKGWDVSTFLKLYSQMDLENTGQRDIMLGKIKKDAP